jgi:hypothetical protein
MGNLGARLSRIEVNPVAGQNGDTDWEDDDLDGIDEHGSGGSKPGGLSSKAGSILVCVPTIPFRTTYHRHIYAGTTQHIYRGTPVPRQRPLGHNVRYL